ncbi:hypothetical protein PVT68_16290 [Microbulbifer bruguierae]|uniref:RND efflux pump membrane fusion protein barrel-sandwich domain-containing protein n=1 Tax=Microbulbifer bruguierae TaxID=3029061 RepID=A0ABY8NC90_9GAMM|nr:hypothetical protein [Microbulbifer bruguierae]WGL16315.1 hypothetical protein PVT68_16290 [Microbulbifer bruguierae]
MQRVNRHYLAIAVSLLLLPLSPSAVFAADLPLLLSGEVRARNSQPFLAPLTDNWRVELQWLMPEGQVAEPGEIVAVFDGASLQGSIDTETVSLTTAQEKLEQETSQHGEIVLTQQYTLKKELLLLKKAQIDAAIPAKYLSTVDYDSYQVSVVEAQTSVNKAKEALAQAELARDVALTKQRINIRRSAAKLALLEERLAQMSVRAERRGPVVYGKHPWTGERVFVGMTAQPNWVIAEIPALQDLYVEAWLHEVDTDRVTSDMPAVLVFDAYQDSPLQVTVSEMATQPEKRKELGPALFYRLAFSFEESPTFELLPGMGARIEIGGTP